VKEFTYITKNELEYIILSQLKDDLYYLALSLKGANNTFSVDCYNKKELKDILVEYLNENENKVFNKFLSFASNKHLVLKDDFNSLIDTYIELKDEVINYSDEYHDMMFFDIEGYIEYYNDDKSSINLNCLLDTIKKFDILLKGLKAFDQIEITYS